MFFNSKKHGAMVGNSSNITFKYFGLISSLNIHKYIIQTYIYCLLYCDILNRSENKTLKIKNQ